ncbi:MAG: O-antigen ligase family protein [Terriglobales bacterium]
MVVLAAGMVHFFPGYLTNTQYVGGIILLELLAAVLWNYRQRFVPVLVVAFLGAGLYTPIQSTFSAMRWAVLMVGALGGVVLYLHERKHWFGLFHAITLSCILSSFASAVDSNFPKEASLKAASLLLLFVYGMTGARIATFPDMSTFLARLLVGLEILTYVAAISYFVFRYPLLGNPNSLGAVMGVGVLPLLLWGVLTIEDTGRRRRLRFAFVLSLLLVLSSYSRAGICAASVAAAFLCIGLREYKPFIRGVVFALVCAVGVAAVMPVTQGVSDASIQNRNSMKKFLYKGHPTEDVLESRRSVWDQTWASIRLHPFFGTGFGTSETSEDTQPSWDKFGVSSSVGVREHGNSYLAILEWQGLLGVVPFLALVVLLVIYLVRVFRWMRRYGEASAPAVALAAIMAAGLFHAGFEDWLFAVGYYLCVFFWMMAFIFVDVLPPRNATKAEPSNVFLETLWPNEEAVAGGR